MKKQRLMFRLYLTLWFPMIVGCTDFVEMELPPSQLTGEAVFNDYATATAALANIYASLRDQTLITGGSRGIGNILGHYADELDYYGSETAALYDFSIHSVLATNSEVATLWNDSYNLIYACNSILEGLEENTSLLEDQRVQIKGEALFLRGFIHFYLSQLFGDIPYVTRTDHMENATIGKLGSSVIHEHLVRDLTGAMELLPTEYVTVDRTRANRFVAMALLARIQLYFGYWEDALSATDTVLGATGQYVWEEDLGKVFLKGSKGILWQLSPGTPGNNTLEALTFIFEQGPPTMGALSRPFMDGFAINDQRAVQWTKSVTDGNDIWYHPYKYRTRGPSGSSVEHSVVLRLGELYLIRAEARMQLRDLDGAMADLNKVRGRAGLPDLGGLNGEELESTLLRERRYELFTEFGHRWFDLRRLQKAGEVLAPLKPNWQEGHLLFPIPQSELLANPNLRPQNDGY
ncbi:RagB/SusD family nutrient uptake outer membrane protein [Flagellimonas amoyensis]|uniref:RagB/SusD family nutrient uptake outer membrane protein n=1 Tax=Flagellimonas amoyensis TaxID=2169401 RepID=UPI000D36674A|nr:RagB/SusD family nutrient uptake outer membrane protein [Allomuricauda amoyensis]